MSNATESQTAPRTVFGEPFEPFDPFEHPTGRNPEPEYWKWYNIYEQLKEPIYENLPYTHPVRWAFLCCEPENDIHPNLSNLKEAIAMFAALPSDIRLNALGGWNLPASMLVPCEPRVEPAIKTCLHFTAGPRMSHLDELSAGLEQFYSGTNEPVEILVHIGTTKMEAVNAIRRAADLLERTWEQTIDRVGRAAESDAAIKEEYQQAKAESAATLKPVPQSEPDAVASHVPKWWERKDCKVRVIQYSAGYGVEAMCTHLNYPYVLGTIALVTMPEDLYDDVVKTADPEGLASKIAADPSILDTIDDPNVLDLRDSHRTPGTSRGITDADIDAFCESQTKFLAGMGLHIIRIANQKIAMPDGSFRESISYDGDDTGIILGPKIKDED